MEKGVRVAHGVGVSLPWTVHRGMLPCPEEEEEERRRRAISGGGGGTRVS